MKLSERERQEVEHWRKWVERGGTTLNRAPMAIIPLIAIIDKLTKALEDK